MTTTVTIVLLLLSLTASLAQDAVDPCQSNDCAFGQRCVPEPKECFTTPCPQYRCEDVDYCAGVTCPDGRDCVSEPKVCITTPCDQYRCDARCIIPECAAPPPGCNYVEPDHDENGCMLNCGHLQCGPCQPINPCPDGQQCVPSQLECATGVCPDYQCVDLCDKNTCPLGTRCVPEPEILCLRFPCQQYRCDAIDYCERVTCPEGTDCVSEPKECITTPCDQYRCQPRCIIPDCAAPPEGCNYVEPEYDANGCMLNCGHLQCGPCEPNPCPEGSECLATDTDQGYTCNPTVHPCIMLCIVGTHCEQTPTGTQCVPDQPPVGCERVDCDGVTHLEPPGSSWSDGCNSCSCTETSRTICTLRACRICQTNCQSTCDATPECESIYGQKCYDSDREWLGCQEKTPGQVCAMHVTCAQSDTDGSYMYFPNSCIPAGWTLADQSKCCNTNPPPLTCASVLCIEGTHCEETKTGPQCLPNVCERTLADGTTEKVAVGTSWKQDCNTCVCNTNGLAICTLIACAPVCPAIKCAAPPAGCSWTNPPVDANGCKSGCGTASCPNSCYPSPCKKNQSCVYTRVLCPADQPFCPTWRCVKKRPRPLAKIPV